MPTHRAATRARDDEVSRTRRNPLEVFFPFSARCDLFVGPGYDHRIDFEKQARDTDDLNRDSGSNLDTSVGRRPPSGARYKDDTQWIKI